MKLKQNRRTFLAIILTCSLLAACAHTGKPQTARELKGMGAVVEYGLAKDASPKLGVNALTDAGNRMFGPSYLISTGGGVSSFGGGSNMSFPRWVRVTWRENTIPGRRWTTGTVVGDYKVEVLSRIPEEVFNYVAAEGGRAIVLKFRLKDDGVLFAWAVQETGKSGHGWVYKMEGGDFLN